MAVGLVIAVGDMYSDGCLVESLSKATSTGGARGVFRPDTPRLGQVLLDCILNETYINKLNSELFNAFLRADLH